MCGCLQRPQKKVHKDQFDLYSPVVMGHVIITGLELVGTASSPRLNERLAGAVRRTVELADSQDISPRERLHVKAVELFSHG